MRVQSLVALKRYRITRDDLSLKAMSVLQSLLPRMWRETHCRKRLREVCAGEQPWRAQVSVH